MTTEEDEDDWAASLDLDSIIAAYRKNQSANKPEPPPEPQPNILQRQHDNQNHQNLNPRNPQNDNNHHPSPRSNPPKPPTSSKKPLASCILPANVRDRNKREGVSEKRKRYFAVEDARSGLDPDDSLPADSGDGAAALVEQSRCLEAFAEANNFCLEPKVLEYLKHLTTKLFPYQARGVARILELSFRAFLYDEMGLGKTVQAIVAAAWWGYLRVWVCNEFELGIVYCGL